MMNPDTLDRWIGARTVLDVGHLTADYLEELASNVLADDHPRTFIGRDVVRHAPDNLIPTLADLNRAGFTTLDFMVGVPWRSGLPPIERRAAVQGFCDTLTMEWLTDALYGTRFQAVATTSAVGTALGDLNRGVPVVQQVNGPVSATFGRQYTGNEIAQLYRGALTSTAVDALTLSWNVTIFDQRWGSNDLWRTLAGVADPELLELAVRHRQALPAA